MRPRLDTETAQQVSADLGLLAHPIRLQILDILARKGGEVCVCDLGEALPVKQPTISHHLKLLREAGVVDCHCRSLWAYYFIRPKALRDLRARIASELEKLC
jgi:ArsR family transcriptional regulator